MAGRTTGLGIAGDGTPGAAEPIRGHVLRWAARRSLRPAAVALVSRIGVLALAAAVAAVTHQTFVQPLTSWDSSWYLKAAAGYPHHLLPGTGNAAQDALGFFPALPVLIRIVHLVLQTGYTTSGLLVTSITGITAGVAVWWLVDDLYGPEAADRGTVLVLWSPGAFVLSMVYGEGLLITAGAFMLLALRRRWWITAGLLGAVVSATDPVGIAVIAPCVWAAWPALRGGDRRALAAPLLAPAGIGAFFLYLWVEVGTPFAWFITQRRGWQGGPLFTSVPGQIGGVFVDGFGNPNTTIKAAGAVVAATFLVVLWRSRPDSTVMAYVLAVLVLGAMSPVVGWSPRLVLRDFPLLALVAPRIPERWFGPVLGLSALLLAVVAALAWSGSSTIYFTP